MLFAETVPPQVANYWAPVAQIVPVFALALVFEARGLASRWRIEGNAVGRRLEAVFLGVGGITLFFIEGEALGRLATGTTSELSVQLTRWALLVAISALAWNPVLSVVTAGFSDTFLLMAKRRPGSAFRSMLKEIDQLERELFEAIQDDEVGLVKVELDLAEADHQLQVLSDTRPIAQRLIAFAPPGASDADRLELIHAYLEIPVAEKSTRRQRKLLKRIRRLHIKSLASANSYLNKIEMQRKKIRLDIVTDEEMAALQGSIERYRMDVPRS